MTDHRSHPTPGPRRSPPDEPLYLHGSVVRGGFTLVAELEVPSDQVVAVLGPNGAGRAPAARRRRVARPDDRAHSSR